MEGFGRRVLSGLDACKINILWTLLLDAWNLSVWLMTCLLPAPHTSSSLPSLPPLSPSLFATSHQQPPHTLCHLSLPSLSVLRACVLAGLFEIWCQIGGPSARWHRLSQWLEKESGEEERDRVGEKEGGKEAALGFASGRAHSSNIDSVLLFCFFLLRAPPPHAALSLSLCESLHILEN